MFLFCFVLFFGVAFVLNKHVVLNGKCMPWHYDQVSLGTIITGDHADYGWNAHFKERRGGVAGVG